MVLLGAGRGRVVQIPAQQAHRGSFTGFNDRWHSHRDAWPVIDVQSVKVVGATGEDDVVNSGHVTSILRYLEVHDRINTDV